MASYKYEAIRLRYIVNHELPRRCTGRRKSANYWLVTCGTTVILAKFMISTFLAIKLP
jgi:hypothetical protein